VRPGIVDPDGPPVIDATGATRSTQATELTLTDAELRALLSPSGLALLAGGYWRFLRRISAGLIHVRQTESERQIVFVGRPVVLLSFSRPEYELAGDRASVRWAITGGLLLARGGRTGRGALEIGVRQVGRPDGGRAPVEVKVAVTDFVPSIAAIFGRRIYNATQARIHVLVTHGFLRWLIRSGPPRPGRRREIGG
jgi:hypothetical protein